MDSRDAASRPLARINMAGGVWKEISAELEAVQRGERCDGAWHGLWGARFGGEDAETQGYVESGVLEGARQVGASRVGMHASGSMDRM